MKVKREITHYLCDESVVFNTTESYFDDGRAAVVQLNNIKGIVNLEKYVPNTPRRIFWIDRTQNIVVRIGDTNDAIQLRSGGVYSTFTFYGALACIRTAIRGIDAIREKKKNPRCGGSGNLEKTSQENHGIEVAVGETATLTVKPRDVGRASVQFVDEGDSMVRIVGFTNILTLKRTKEKYGEGVYNAYYGDVPHFYLSDLDEKEVYIYAPYDIHNPKRNSPYRLRIDDIVNNNEFLRLIMAMQSGGQRLSNIIKKRGAGVTPLIQNALI